MSKPVKRRVEIGQCLETKPKSTCQETPKKEGDKLKKLGLPEVWKTALDRGYSLKRKLGRGGSGLVVSAIVQGQELAIKHMEVDNEFSYPLVKAIREFQIMEQLSHPPDKNSNMVHYYTGLLDAFAPYTELRTKRVKNIFLVMPMG